MRHYHGQARNALARTLEPPQRKRFEVKRWALRAWLVVLALGVAAVVARC